MVAVQRFSPLVRAILVIGAVAGLVTGVTFAIAQDAASLEDNSFTSASTSLLVSATGGCEDGTTGFGETAGGFSLTGLVPGGDASADQTFCLKNDGGTDLDVTVYASGGSLSGVLDKSKVKFTFTNVTDGGAPATYSLAQLEALFNNVPNAGDKAAAGPMIPDGTTEKFTVSVQLEDGAVSGSGAAGVSGFDLVFTGSNEAEL